MNTVIASIEISDEQHRRLEQFVQRMIEASPREAQQNDITDVATWATAMLKQLVRPIIGQE